MRPLVSTMQSSRALRALHAAAVSDAVSRTLVAICTSAVPSTTSAALSLPLLPLLQ